MGWITMHGVHLLIGEEGDNYEYVSQGDLGDNVSEHLQTVKGWQGQRGIIARESLNLMREDSGEFKGCGFKKNGKLSGLYVGRFKEGNYVIEGMASNEKGLGKAMIKSACITARNNKSGIKLTSLKSAEGFYRKIGMREIGKDEGGLTMFHFDSDNVNKFITSK